MKANLIALAVILSMVTVFGLLHRGVITPTTAALPTKATLPSNGSASRVCSWQVLAESPHEVYLRVGTKAEKAGLVAAFPASAGFYEIPDELPAGDGFAILYCGTSWIGAGQDLDVEMYTPYRQTFHTEKLPFGKQWGQGEVAAVASDRLLDASVERAAPINSDLHCDPHLPYAHEILFIRVHYQHKSTPDWLSLSFELESGGRSVACLMGDKPNQSGPYKMMPHGGLTEGDRKDVYWLEAPSPALATIDRIKLHLLYLTPTGQRVRELQQLEIATP